MTDSFATAIAALTSTPATTATGAGLLGPLARIYGHLLWTLTENINERMTDAENAVEFDHAIQHFSAIDTSGFPPLSTRAADAITTFGEALNFARDDLSGWGSEEIVENLRQLANASVHLCSTLDREFIGIRSDPGTSF